ncbi:hypothetical protein T492DRAFT_1062527 [Pavlovales sp. CCMP2436]|nr:hypothetical protein T492DRAFT_1062527 [Pavlovales sp. CCMP2436]
MICWLLFVVLPRWAAIGASALKRASSSCAWPSAAIVPIVSMSCFLMRAAASIGLRSLMLTEQHLLNHAEPLIYIYDRDASWRLTVLNVVLV